MERDSVNSCTLVGGGNQCNNVIIQLHLHFNRTCNICANLKKAVKTKLGEKKKCNPGLVLTEDTSQFLKRVNSGFEIFLNFF